MSQENQDLSTNQLILYANNLEQILLNLAKYNFLSRKAYERDIQNLAQLSINKGIDIDDVAKEINQEKKNEKLNAKIKNNNNEGKKQDINEIEINNISNQIFCKDFYNNLSQYLKRKKEILKINHLFNNNSNNKNNYGNTNINNKYKNQIEQNNIYDSKKNTIYIPNDSSKSNSKFTGKKRKNK